MIKDRYKDIHFLAKWKKEFSLIYCWTGLFLEYPFNTAAALAQYLYYMLQHHTCVRKVHKAVAIW